MRASSRACTVSTSEKLSPENTRRYTIAMGKGEHDFEYEGGARSRRDTRRRKRLNVQNAVAERGRNSASSRGQAWLHGKTTVLTRPLTTTTDIGAQ